MNIASKKYFVEAMLALLYTTTVPSSEDLFILGARLLTAELLTAELSMPKPLDQKKDSVDRAAFQLRGANAQRS